MLFLSQFIWECEGWEKERKKERDRGIKEKDKEQQEVAERLETLHLLSVWHEKEGEREKERKREREKERWWEVKCFLTAVQWTSH